MAENERDARVEGGGELRGAQCLLPCLATVHDSEQRAAGAARGSDNVFKGLSVPNDWHVLGRGVPDAHDKVRKHGVRGAGTGVAVHRRQLLWRGGV